MQEGEFSRALKVMERQGNTLSDVLRSLWDNGSARAITKNSPARCTNAHVSILGHITRDELRRELTETDAANGFGNRFLFVCSRRSKVLPEGGNVASRDVEELGARFAEAVRFARALRGPLYRDDEARALWHREYEELSEGRPGLIGAITSRGEAQVMRLAVLYAVLDERTQVGVDHLEAALAVWRYCEQSAAYVFSDATGDTVADEILTALRSTGSAGMTRSEIRDLFARNRSSDRIGTALASLEGHGLAHMTREATGGRPTERWYAVNDVNAESRGAS